MSALLLDTHTWIWSLVASPRLSSKVLNELATAATVYVSPISFFEISQKVRLGKWPDMEEMTAQLPSLLRQQGGLIATLTPEICQKAGGMEWAHRDPFDRLLAATSLTMGVPLASADPVFDQLSINKDWIARVW